MVSTEISFSSSGTKPSENALDGKFVNPLPSPTKALAVIIPVVFTEPSVPIPTPVKPDPSPTKLVAVTTPVIFAPPDVILRLLLSVVSPTMTASPLTFNALTLPLVIATEVTLYPTASTLSPDCAGVVNEKLIPSVAA